jgi:hypothetical protein
VRGKLHSLKVELIHGEPLLNGKQTRESFFEYIEVDYNRYLRSSLVARRSSLVARRSSLVARRSSLVARRSSLVARRSSP